MSTYPNNPKQIFVAFAVALIFIAECVAAGDSNYQQLSLQEGISIEVPRHWLVHSDLEKKNFAAAGEASMGAAGIKKDTTEKSTSVLAVSALPMPTGAKIRITVVRPLRFTGADLRAATAKDLKETHAELRTEMSKSLTATGGQLLALDIPRIETLDSQSAFLIKYRRTEGGSPTPWVVARYRIPVGDKLVEFTTSYRESDAIIFQPILENVKRSLKLK